MRPANPRLVIARAAALGIAALGCWSLVACAKTPAAAHPAEAATAPAKAGAGATTTPAPRGQAALRQARRPRQEGVHPGRDQRVVGLRQGAEPHQLGRRTLPALDQRPALRRQADRAGVHRLGDRARSWRTATAPVTAKKIDVADAPMKGNPNAKITLIEFADYECPHCKRFQPVLHQILDEFRERGEALLQALPAAPAHQRARSRPRRRWRPRSRASSGSTRTSCGRSRTSLTPAEIEKAAKEVGLDVAKFRQDMASEAVKARVQKDRTDGAGGRHPGDARRSTSTAASTPTAATPTACANGSRTP